MKYAKVAINLPVKNMFRQFTYRVPESMDFLDEGWRVVVPFGSQMLEGFIVEEDREPDLSLDLKAIADVLGTAPWFDQEMLATAHWLSQYYLCTLAEALRLFIPGKSSVAVTGRYQPEPDFAGELTKPEQEFYDYLLLRGGRSRKEICRLDGGENALKGLITKGAVSLSFATKYKLREKTERTLQSTAAGRQALKDGLIRGKSRQAALSLLPEKTVLTSHELHAKGISNDVIHALVLLGDLEEGQRRVLRDSYEHLEAPRENLQLTPEQQAAVEAVDRARTEKEPQTFLLEGITGSGKTEVYLRLTDRAVRAGQQVMVLVPEIALTGQIVRRFKAWFSDHVAVAHSKLSANERADVWERMRSGQARVLIGVRSAVFCPFENLGLIIIDEEHEGTYKQETRPSYHARLVAQYRAHYRKVPVLLLGHPGPGILLLRPEGEIYPAAVDPAGQKRQPPAPGIHCGHAGGAAAGEPVRTFGRTPGKTGADRPAWGAGHCAAKPPGLLHLCAVPGLRGGHYLSPLRRFPGVPRQGPAAEMPLLRLYHARAPHLPQLRQQADQVLWHRHGKGRNGNPGAVSGGASHSHGPGFHLSQICPRADSQGLWQAGVQRAFGHPDGGQGPRHSQCDPGGHP